MESSSSNPKIYQALTNVINLFPASTSRQRGSAPGCRHPCCAERAARTWQSCAAGDYTAFLPAMK